MKWYNDEILAKLDTFLNSSESFNVLLCFIKEEFYHFSMFCHLVFRQALSVWSSYLKLGKSPTKLQITMAQHD